MITDQGIVMTARQQALALFASVGLLVLIIELVRRRKLREEYSWLWLLTGVGLLVLAVWYRLLLKITNIIGAVLPISTLFFFGLFFLILISISYSVQISKLNNQVKNLAQKLSILDGDLQEIKRSGISGERSNG